MAQPFASSSLCCEDRDEVLDFTGCGLEVLISELLKDPWVKDLDLRANGWRLIIIG